MPTPAHTLLVNVVMLHLTQVPKLSKTKLSLVKCVEGTSIRSVLRRKQRGGNWQRDPWFCASCTLGHDPGPGSMTDNHLIASRPALHLEDNAIIEMTTDEPSVSEHVNPLVNHHRRELNPEAITFLPGATVDASVDMDEIPPDDPSISPILPALVSLQPVTAAGHPNQNRRTQIPKLPSNAIRQRSSNVISSDPDKEFLKTALDTCRSNIAKQETELKKLKETLEIRNKKILQLEEQIGEAASYIGRRNTSDDATDGNTTQRLEDCILLLVSKLESSSNDTSSPVNNISIYSQGCLNKTTTSLYSQATQTEASFACENCKQTNENPSKEKAHNEPSHKPPVSNSLFRCTSCVKFFLSEKELTSHIESKHATDSSKPAVFAHTCKHCKRKFSSKDHMKEHIETELASNPVSCTSCHYECESRSHLKVHIDALHSNPPEDSTPTLSSSSSSISMQGDGEPGTSSSKQSQAEDL